jgi:hypothetical protein
MARIRTAAEAEINAAEQMQKLGYGDATAASTSTRHARTRR